MEYMSSYEVNLKDIWNNQTSQIKIGNKNSTLSDDSLKLLLNRLKEVYEEEVEPDFIVVGGDSINYHHKSSLPIQKQFISESIYEDVFVDNNHKYFSYFFALKTRDFADYKSSLQYFFDYQLNKNFKGDKDLFKKFISKIELEYGKFLFKGIEILIEKYFEISSFDTEAFFSEDKFQIRFDKIVTKHKTSKNLDKKNTFGFKYNDPCNSREKIIKERFKTELIKVNDKLSLVENIEELFDVYFSETLDSNLPINLKCSTIKYTYFFRGIFENFFKSNFVEIAKTGLIKSKKDNSISSDSYYKTDISPNTRDEIQKFIDKVNNLLHKKQ